MLDFSGGERKQFSGRSLLSSSKRQQKIDRVEFTSNPIVVIQVYGQPGGAANEGIVRMTDALAGPG